MRDAPVFPPDLDPDLLPLLQLARPDLAFGRGAAGALERGKPLVYFALTSTVSALLRRSPPASASSFQSRLLSSYPAFPGEKPWPFGPDDDGVVEAILVRVSAGCGGWQHDVSIDATATFGDLKVLLSLATSLWPREQRLLYRGRERDDGDHLHMTGVQDKDKVLLLEDPAVTERKLRSTSLAQLMGVPCHSFIQV